MAQQNNNHQANSYIQELLQKNTKGSGRALDYINNKNSQLQNKLKNGQQLISQKQQTIQNISKGKPQLKNDHDFRKIHEIQSQKAKIQKKLQILQQNITQLSSQKKIQIQKGKIIPQEDRHKFLKQKRKQNFQLTKKRQQYFKKLQQMMLEEQKKKKQEQIVKQKEDKQKKSKKAKQKIQLINQRKTNRQIQIKKTNEILKQKQKQKTLAQKLQQRFQHNQNLALQQKKKKLAELRMIHRPMNRQQLQQHARKFQSSRIEAQSKKKHLNLSVSEQKIYYRSMFHEKIKRQEKQKLDLQLQEKQNQKSLKDRAKKYAEQIKTKFKPEIDQKKANQIFERMRNKSGQQIKGDRKFKGLQYLEFTKQYALKHKKDENQNQKTDSNELIKSEGRRTQAIDYLSELRKDQNSRLKQTSMSVHDYIRRVQKNQKISKNQKQEKIIAYAQNLQKKAKEKEQQLKRKSILEVDEDIDRLYISAIQAKLKVLEK